MNREPSINDQLWIHFLRGGGLASIIRNRPSGTDWKNNLYRFFTTTDDFNRILEAHDLAKIVLRQYNMEYLVPLRDLVTQMELQRVPVYDKQTDHTIHTIYLYLLGIWFFDNSAEFRKIYTEIESKSNYNERFTPENFNIQWIFAGLMHDIGYLFDNMALETAMFRREIDKLVILDDRNT